MSNRLVEETSPYLLQHADNPVDWYPWCKEALSRAKTENKPILLSIGYSACHWCHVMAHESFENTSIAKLMNQNFINIKVDREERPDLDSLYMEAVQVMTGSGGWPLTVFLTPDGKPFYGGNYFPPEDRQGMPGFPKVLQAIADAYSNNRNELDYSSKTLVSALEQKIKIGSASESLTDDIFRIAYEAIKQHYDPKNGGFGHKPKFPQAMVLEFLMRYSKRFHYIHALRMVEHTLDKMCRGGIYDQLGGGFHRYSTDEQWLVPHFEKMLYDNALLSRIYLNAFLYTGKLLYRSIAEGTLNYVLYEMTSAEGGFYSSQDADSDGVEGKYYVWNDKEINDLLGSSIGETVNRYFGITAEGNYEGNNILSIVGGKVEDLNSIEKAKISLLDKRKQRVKPKIDEKILASWNGLMLGSFSEAGCVLKNKEYLQAAIANGRFILSNMIVEGKLKHVYKDSKATIDGFLLDYAATIDGLLALHQSTLQSEWLLHAIKLGEMMVDKFWDSQKSLLFDTSFDQKDLFMRPRNVFDDAIPSGTSIAIVALLRLARITGSEQFKRITIQSIQSIVDLIPKYPLGLGNWLCVLDLYLSQAKDIIIVGNTGHVAMQEILGTICSIWLPNKLVLAHDPDSGNYISDLKVFESKHMQDGVPTVYVCEGTSCKKPVTDLRSLKTLLE